MRRHTIRRGSHLGRSLVPPAQIAPELSRPFTVRRGQTVEDIAALIQKDLVVTLRWARLWRGEIEGLQVGKNHPVEDGDVLEIHTH